MWPCRNPGEDARLYKAVEACSDFVCKLGINIPTGKDSLSMTQKYGDDKVLAPGTVIISAAGEVKNIRKIVSPTLAYIKGTYIYYVAFSSVSYTHLDVYKRQGNQCVGKVRKHSAYAGGKAVFTTPV